MEEIILLNYKAFIIWENDDAVINNDRIFFV
jgi:hypothetical protein